MKNRLSIAIFLLVIFTPSCGLRKQIGGESVNIRNLKQLRKALERPAPEFQWITASAKIKYQTKDQNLSLSVNYKHKKDSVFWMRMSKFIEVARIRVLADKFEMINRIDRTYLSSDFSKIEPFIGSSVQGFAAAERIMFGEIPFIPEAEDALSISDGQLLVTHRTDQYTQHIWLNSHSLKVEKMTVFNPQDQSEATIEMKEYVLVDEILVPSVINISLSGKENTSITLSFSNIEFHQKEKADFEIPEDYKILH